MADEQIKVTIDEEGKMTVKTDGLKGAECLEELDKLLGDIALISGVNFTKEYKEKPRTQRRRTSKKQNVGQGGDS
jgi:hypothetical protein